MAKRRQHEKPKSTATDTTARVILPRHVREQLARDREAQEKAGAPAEQQKTEE